MELTWWSQVELSCDGRVEWWWWSQVDLSYDGRVEFCGVESCGDGGVELFWCSKIVLVRWSRSSCDGGVECGQLAKLSCIGGTQLYLLKKYKAQFFYRGDSIKYERQSSIRKIELTWGENADQLCAILWVLIMLTSCDFVLFCSSTYKSTCILSSRAALKEEVSIYEWQSSIRNTPPIFSIHFRARIVLQRTDWSVSLLFLFVRIVNTCFLAYVRQLMYKVLCRKIP